MSESRAGILQISIQDFRGIERLDLDFRDPSGEPNRIVVLAGPNGCGKTAVLEACLLACDQQKLALGAVDKRAVRRSSESVEYQIRASIKRKHVTRDVVCTNDRGIGRAFPCTYFSSRRSVSLVAEVGITTGARASLEPQSEADRLRYIKQFLVNAKARELFSEKRGEANGAYSKALGRVNQAWQMFYADQSFSADEVASPRPDAGFDVFVTYASGQSLPVDLLSSGQLELFAFIGILALEGHDQLGLILIDEPELHLDPQWHRQVLRVIELLRPRCQIIVATHSPEVYDSVRSFERHFLVPADDPRAREWSPRATSEEHVA